MARHNVSQAVELLEEIINRVDRLKVSERSQGSLRALSIGLRKARVLLLNELEQPEPHWYEVAELLRAAARWVCEVLIDNLQYIFRPLSRGYKAMAYGNRACA